VSFPAESFEFFLPLGLCLEGKTYRKGKMHLATTGDELEIQAGGEADFSPRYRDIFLLARVIDELEGLSPVTPAMIEELYEADFLYLQLLYKQANGETDEGLSAACPACGQAVPVRLPRLYESMDAYKKEKGQA
jgi:rRNA maturation protein Nop10